jgi:hypothetical protein
MAGHLQQKWSVAPFVQENAGRRAFDRKTAQDTQPRSVSEVLVSFLAFQPNAGDRFNSARALFRRKEISWNGGQKRGNCLQPHY